MELDMASKGTGLPVNIAMALCYVPAIGFLVSIVLLVIETDKEVRWHAVQGLVLALGVWLVSFVLGMTVILAILVPIVWLAVFVLQIVLAVKAYSGKPMRLPYVEKLVDTIVSKITV
jgi:uncharacterized membrane protein